MKIVFNGLPISYPLSGVGEYTVQLGRSLEALLGGESIFWFGATLSNNGCKILGSTGPNTLNYLEYEIRKNLRKIPGLNSWIHRLRDHQFQSYTRKIKPSLYHETNYVPFNFESGPTLMTIYDLSFVRHPEWHPINRVKFYEKYCLTRLHRAMAIFTISEFSKMEIVNLLNISPSKIYVTHPGVKQSLTVEKKQITGLPQNYILYVGNIEPRKNLPTLLDGYSSLPKEIKDSYALVIAGAKGWSTHEFENKLHLFQKKEKIILLGYVSQPLLPDLYRGASLFVYPSFYEGFGLPVIEAMACGVPVIASNSASIPEVVGDAGILFNPYDPHDLKNKMLEAIEDSKTRGELSEKGIQRAKRYSWQKCAQDTLAVYKKMMSDFNPQGDMYPPSLPQPTIL